MNYLTFFDLLHCARILKAAGFPFGARQLYLRGLIMGTLYATIE